MSILVFLLTVLIGGTNAPSVKFAIGFFPPVTLVFIRSLLAAALILPFIYKSVTLPKTNFKYLLAANILFGANWMLFAAGLQHTSVVVGQLAYVPTALLVAVIGYIFLKEKLTKEHIAGLFLTMAGISLYAYNSVKSQDVVSFGTPLGNLLVVMALLSWAFYIVITRKISRDYSPIVITFYNFAVTAIMSCLLLSPVIFSGDLVSRDLTPTAISGFLYLVAFPSIGFFVLNQWLIKHTSAFVSSLALYPITVVAGILGVLLYGEKVTIAMIVGAAFIFSGVFIATSYKHAKRYISR